MSLNESNAAHIPLRPPVFKLSILKKERLKRGGFKKKLCTPISPNMPAELVQMFSPI